MVCSCIRDAATVVEACDDPASVIAGFGGTGVEEIVDLAFLLFAAVVLVDVLSTVIAGVVDDLPVVDLGSRPGVLRFWPMV